MIPFNGNHGREFSTWDEAWEELRLQGAVIFLLRRLRGHGWRIDVRSP